MTTTETVDTESDAQSGKQRPACPMCPKTFARTAGLTRHMRNVHPGATAEEIAAVVEARTEGPMPLASSSVHVDTTCPPMPASGVSVGDVLLMFDGVERTVTRRATMVGNVTLYFGPFYWVTMPGNTPVRPIGR
jgi:hypothetical protein